MSSTENTCSGLRLKIVDNATFENLRCVLNLEGEVSAIIAITGPDNIVNIFRPEQERQNLNLLKIELNSASATKEWYEPVNDGSGCWRRCKETTGDGGVSREHKVVWCP